MRELPRLDKLSDSIPKMFVIQFYVDIFLLLSWTSTRRDSLQPEEREGWAALPRNQSVHFNVGNIVFIVSKLELFRIFSKTILKREDKSKMFQVSHGSAFLRVSCSLATLRYHGDGSWTSKSNRSRFMKLFYEYGSLNYA